MSNRSVNDDARYDSPPNTKRPSSSTVPRTNRRVGPLQQAAVLRHQGVNQETHAETFEHSREPDGKHVQHPEEDDRPAERHRKNRQSKPAIGFPLLRESLPLTCQQGRHGDGDDAEHDEDVAPAEILSEEAAERAPGNLAHHQRAHESSESNLTGFVGKLVADVAERHRDDGRGRDTGQEPQHRKDRQVGDEGARERADGKERQTGGHHPQFADAIPERTVEQLEQSVRQRIRRNHDRRARRNRVKVLRDHMKQRVDHAGVRLDHERRHAEHQQRSTPEGGNLCRCGGGLQEVSPDDRIREVYPPGQTPTGLRCSGSGHEHANTRNINRHVAQPDRLFWIGWGNPAIPPSNRSWCACGTTSHRRSSLDKAAAEDLSPNSERGTLKWRGKSFTAGRYKGAALDGSHGFDQGRVHRRHRVDR